LVENEHLATSVNRGANTNVEEGTTSTKTTSVSTRKDSFDVNVIAERGTKKSNQILPQSTIPTVDLSTPGSTHTALVSYGSKVVYPRNPKIRETLPIPLHEIGKASRLGDTLGGKCNVFEVVLQSKEEKTMCPACTRSDKRAKLPAHARNCFASS
jgi:hypothetical protein